MSARRKLSAFLIRAGGLLLLAANSPAASPTTQQRAGDAVRVALKADPRRPIALLGSALDGNRLTLNFSQELLDLAPGSLGFEEWSRGVHIAAGDVLRDEFPAFEIHTLIGGVPLDRLLPLVAGSSTPPEMSLPSNRVTPPRAALVGRRVALSPGHGYYLNASARWVLQRDFYSGIVEDFVNHDFISLVQRLLAEEGAVVLPTRNLDRTAGNGESGFPKWQEAARYHVKALGAAPTIWNEPGFDDLSQDIRCRPLYANSVNAELLVSIHNNGGGGTGTETLYDTNHSAAAESKRLADLLHARVIAAIRRDYNPTWADRRVQGFNGSYGENRLATRAAVIIEIAFMDRPTPDNLALRDERFKQIVAAAIRDGIREFLDGTTALAPASPEGLLATAEATAIALRWTDTATNETGFRVERKTTPASPWTTIATLAANTTTYRDTTATSSASYLYRVQAFNATSVSGQFSNEAAAETLAPAFVLSVSPASSQSRNWNEEAVFTLGLVDAAVRAFSGASIAVRDLVRNTSQTLSDADADATGRLTYRTTVPLGQSDGTYPITFQATRGGSNLGAAITRDVVVSRSPPGVLGAPTIQRQPLPQTVPAGTNVGFSVITAVSGSNAPSPSYQWLFNDAPIAGATNGAIAFTPVTRAQAGSYAVVITTPFGTVESLPTPLTVTPNAWLSNASLRSTLLSAQSLIVGFVVQGGRKDLLVRAAGPALSAFGLTTAMADPRLEVFRGGVRVADNNDWPAALAPVFAGLGAFAFPAASRDAAVLQAFDGPGSVVVTGSAGGVVLVEGYDAGTSSAVRLINLSARNRVGTGADAMIAGFVIAGTGTQRVLIRAIGPTLAAFGVTAPLADPRLEVRDATGLIAENDNWDPNLAPVFAQAGAFALPAGSRDAAVVLTLPAGRSYTAQVSGVGPATGEALVEVYEVP